MMEAGLVIMGNVNGSDERPYDHQVVVIDPHEHDDEIRRDNIKNGDRSDKTSIDNGDTEDEDNESSSHLSSSSDMSSFSKDSDDGSGCKLKNGDLKDDECPEDDNSAENRGSEIDDEKGNNDRKHEESDLKTEKRNGFVGDKIVYQNGDSKTDEEIIHGDKLQNGDMKSDENGKQNGTNGFTHQNGDSEDDDSDECEADPGDDVIQKDAILREERQEELGKCLLQDFLGKSNTQAEARLAARRQARAEAREIRMRELERQQKEIDENKGYDSHSDSASRVPRTPAAPVGRNALLSTGGTNSYQSSRRSSEDSLEEGTISLRDMRHELKELEDKFRKAMIQNAQLDNEKASCTYQVELLKDRIEDLEEAQAQLQREHRDRCREHDQLKRLATKLKEDLEWYKSQLEERDRLIQEKGLTIVGEDIVSSDEEGEVNGDIHENSVKKTPKKALVSIESAEILQNAGGGSLDVQLRRFAEERNELLDQIRHLKLELEEERSRHKTHNKKDYGAVNGSDTDVEDVQRETNKLLAEYKFKVQKAEQDVSTLQANVARLESQVIRYKSAAESAEKVEDELKVEKRKLQRELRESQARVEELELSNSHLQRRLDKLKNAKSALLKEL